MTPKSYIHTIGNMAVEALKFEASTTPKPGLVDRDNTGSHKDMDYAMFLASSESLRNCFQQCVEAGAKADQLRTIGMEGERAMFRVTKDVNTHKGLIFSMGILCGALGEFCANGVSFDEGDLQQLCAKLAAELLEHDRAQDTHGLAVLKKTGIKGIRGEALSGFSSAFDIGLPALRQALAEGYPFERAMIKTLLVLMANTDDSNLVHRGGEEGLAFAKSYAKNLLDQGDFRKDEDLDLVRDFDATCIDKNLSPGGSADLLALTAMLYLFFEEF